MKQWILCFALGMAFVQVAEARDFLKEIEARYAGKGEVEDALAVAKAFAEAHADSISAHGFLGTLYAETGQLDAAVTAFQKVIALKPSSVRGYRDLAVVFAQQGEFSQAFDALGQGIEQSEEPVLLLVERASLNRDLGKREEAIADFEAAINRRPNFIEAYQTLALTHIAFGDTLAAIAVMDPRAWGESGQRDVDGQSRRDFPRLGQDARRARGVSTGHCDRAGRPIGPSRARVYGRRGRFVGDSTGRLGKGARALAR